MNAQEEIETLLTDNGITIACEFVPFSRSRNAKPNAKINDLTLNWKITVQHKGRDVLTCDYSAGIAHAPSYKQKWGSGFTIKEAKQLRNECETGFRAKLPQPADVISSLILDGQAMDYRSFSEWADEFGYDGDSIKAKAIYDQCLAHGLAIKNTIGDELYAALSEACANY
jgi:hypothetical protein